MPWIRVTRITSEPPTQHEAVLLNAAHILSIEQMHDTTYVFLRDGRHFAVADSLEMLWTTLMPLAE
jgi:uncharacterized protein YlzI (FlbEa/FlbD family)